jgi:hypothetical protein
MEKNFTKLVHDCRIADKAKFVYQCLPLLVRCVLLRAPRCVLNTSFFFAIGTLNLCLLLWRTVTGLWCNHCSLHLILVMGHPA